MIGKHFKAKSGWISNGNGSDMYGFSALPGGGGNSNGGFFSFGSTGFWWNATDSNASNAYLRIIHYYHHVNRMNDDKKSMYSVRCVKD
jgi:uncharacterized protein (TIGR02145 family)